LSVDDLDVRIHLSVGARAGDLNPLARHLIVVADAVLGKAARLPIHLDRAARLELEGRDRLVLLRSAQHAHVPRPVEEYCAQILGAGRGRVARGAPPCRCAAAPTTATAATAIVI